MLKICLLLAGGGLLRFAAFKSDLLLSHSRFCIHDLTGRQSVEVTHSHTRARSDGGNEQRSHLVVPGIEHRLLARSSHFELSRLFMKEGLFYDAVP